MQSSERTLQYWLVSAADIQTAYSTQQDAIEQQQ